MTDQLEPVDDATQYRRRIDDSLARFSAAHDEGQAEEAKRRERRLRPAALIEQTMTRLHRVTGTEPAAAAQPAAESAADQPAPRTRLQEKKQRHNRRSLLTGRVAAIVLAALIFLGTGVAWGAKTWFDASFTQVDALDENSADIQNAAGQSGDQNFLIVGSDTRAGAAAEEGVGDAGSIPGARSDTVMVAHIPADRKRAVLVSFPRDLEVNRPECKRWDTAKADYTDETVPAQRIVKLNSVYAVGGPQCVTKLIQQISGMKLNHFVGIDFNGFKGMVDAVHGVSVHTDGPIDDGILGLVIPKAGDTTISGDQALNFVRARHVKGDPTSDYGRIKRQQAFLSSLLKKTMSSDVVLDPGKLTDFVTAFAKATFGQNIGVDQMLTLAQSMKGLDTGKIDFLTVPTVGEANSRGNEVLLPNRTATLFRALIENGPLPSVAPGGPDTPSASGNDGGVEAGGSTRSPRAGSSSTSRSATTGTSRAGSSGAAGSADH